MGDGTKENPFTREDVLKAIKGNGDTAEGLDLSGKVFEEGIDLRKLDLSGINLKDSIFLGEFSQSFNVDGSIREEKNTGALFLGSTFDYANLEGICLTGANLKEARLTDAKLKGANLCFVNFERARLQGVHLEEASLIFANLKGAYLVDACLEGADLRSANLEDANLKNANLTRAHCTEATFNGSYLAFINLDRAMLRYVKLRRVCLYLAKFSYDTDLENVDWGDYILEEEKYGWFGIAITTYLGLKVWHMQKGLYDIAGEFFYREMEVRRKALSWKNRPFHKLWGWVLRLLCGYGERPLRVIAWAASVVLGLAFLYFVIGSVWEWSALWKSLYFSTVSFTALGYGGWVNLNNDLTSDIIRGIGAFESFIGVFTMALFLITFVRKMIR